MEIISGSRGGKTRGLEGGGGGGGARDGSRAACKFIAQGRGLTYTTE